MPATQPASMLPNWQRHYKCQQPSQLLQKQHRLLYRLFLLLEQLELQKLHRLRRGGAAALGNRLQPDQCFRSMFYGVIMYLEAWQRGRCHFFFLAALLRTKEAVS